VTPEPVAASPAASDSSTGAAVAIVLGALGAVALVLILFAAIPPEFAPWYWAEQQLASRRQQFAVSGAMCVLAEGAVFALVFLGG
jgi:multisubunit Na+/H+ antiporter MnhB subunit